MCAGNFLRSSYSMHTNCKKVEGAKFETAGQKCRYSRKHNLFTMLDSENCRLVCSHLAKLQLMSSQLFIIQMTVQYLDHVSACDQKLATLGFKLCAK